MSKHETLTVLGSINVQLVSSLINTGLNRITTYKCQLIFFFGHIQVSALPNRNFFLTKNYYNWTVNFFLEKNFRFWAKCFEQKIWIFCCSKKLKFREILNKMVSLKFSKSPKILKGFFWIGFVIDQNFEQLTFLMIGWFWCLAICNILNFGEGLAFNLALWLRGTWIAKLWLKSWVVPK